MDRIIELLEEQNQLLRQLVDALANNPNNNEDHMLTPKEAAKYLNIGYDTLLSWARQGIIPSAKPGGHRVLFNKKSLDEWQAEQEGKRNPRPKPEENQMGKLRKIIT